MNKRIKQLAEQAGILKEQSVQAKIVKNEDGTWTSILEYPDLEKFAELIVLECVEIIDDTHQRQGINIFILDKIKEHFGVEE